MNRRRVKKGVAKMHFYAGPTGFGPRSFPGKKRVRAPGLGRLEARIMRILVSATCAIRRRAFADAVFDVLGEQNEVLPVDVRIVRRGGRRMLEVR